MEPALPMWITNTIAVAGGVGVIVLFAAAYLWCQRPDRPRRKHRRTP